MTVSRKLAPKAMRLKRQIERARKLAEMSNPLVAELYSAHAKLCETKLAFRNAGKQVRRS